MQGWSTGVWDENKSSEMSRIWDLLRQKKKKKS